MTIFWTCKTTSNASYNSKIQYLSEPSIDLIEKFKQEIVTYQDPTQHPDYVPCNHVERSKGHLLFILRGRVEVLIRPDKQAAKLFFMNCEDNC
jgi:hypothetical protein